MTAETDEIARRAAVKVTESYQDQKAVKPKHHRSTTEWQRFCIETANIHGKQQIWSNQYRDKIEEAINALGLKRILEYVKAREHEIQTHGPHFLFFGTYGGALERLAQDLGASESQEEALEHKRQMTIFNDILRAEGEGEDGS